MTEDNTGNTPSVDDNLLGLSSPKDIDREESVGVARGERFLLSLDENVEINTRLILDIHKVVFGHLYEWAGKWRTKQVNVGAFVPPEFHQLPNLMYQFTDELAHRMKLSTDRKELVKILAYCHHRLVYVHPFNNGNGRTARLITNLVALKFGYGEINIYHRTGKKRNVYIKAIRAADGRDFFQLEELIDKELVSLNP